MLKKLFKYTFIFLGAAIIVAGIYVFSEIATRPTPAPNAQTFVVDADYKPAQANADAWLSTLYNNHQIPSVSAAIAVHGKLVWSGAIGYADLNQKILADNHSLYRIGSISKSLTAVAAIRMNEKNLLHIDSPFNRYVNDFPSAHTYTIKQLLSHQAGIRHYNGSLSDSFNTTEYSTTKDAANIVKNDPLLFAPGTNFRYTTYGYTLLALAMESAYPAPFEKIMATEIISPIGLNDTYPNKINTQPKQNLTQPYWLISDSFFEAPEENVSHKYAGGGYISTPTDLVKFGSALLTDEFITPASRTLLWTPVPLNNGTMNTEHYALGFRVGQDERGTFVHHGGTTNGGYSFLLIYPDAGIVVALASNFTSTGSGFDRLQEAKKLVGIFEALKL